MERLKSEYNKIARECLVQLTTFRQNVQSWTSQHPEYGKVADWILAGAKYGADLIAGIGIITSFAGTAPISLPLAIGGASFSISKIYFANYIRDKFVRYAIQQGRTLKEQLEFERTALWIFDSIAGIRNTKTTLSTIRKHDRLFKTKFTKTHVARFDRYGEIAGMLRKASSDYYKSRRELLMNDVLRIFTHE